jgi:hypothetical protein
MKAGNTSEVSSTPEGDDKEDVPDFVLKPDNVDDDDFMSVPDHVEDVDDDDDNNN